MQKKPEKAANDDASARESSDTRGGPTRSGKQPYQKPRLTKHEQLHGIGLGSP